MDEQFDSRTRIMTMLRNKMRAEKQLSSLAKPFSRFQQSAATVRVNIDRQQREFEKLYVSINQRREELEKRITFIETVRNQLSAAKERNATLQAQLEQTKEKQRQIKASVRTLSEATNTYIDAKALPGRLKGVAVTRDGLQWVPFDLPGNKTNGLGALWMQLQRRNANYSNTWRQLLSDSSPPKPAFSDKENIVTASMSAPIIRTDVISSSPYK